MLPLLALSTLRDYVSSSESSSCGDSDSSSDSESYSEHGGATNGTNGALDASKVNEADTGRRRGRGGGRRRGGRSRSRGRSKAAKQSKRANKRLEKERKRMEKERKRMENERKRLEKERNKKDDAADGDEPYYDDEEYGDLLCLNEREWELYRQRDVWDIPSPSMRGKKSCMNREEWMELHDAYKYN
jgi:hypothetical protein